MHHGDFSFRNQSPWLMIGAIVLMLLGALFVAVFFAMLTDMWSAVASRNRWAAGRITGLRGHVLVIGLGSVGMQVLSGLAAARGQRRGRGREARRQPASQPGPGPRRAGGHRGRHPARNAGIGTSLASASAAAVLTSDDLANLETGLAVRDQLGNRWERTPVVLRMFDPQLARSIRHNFGFRNVRSTAALAAPWFVGAALGLDVLHTIYVGDAPLLVARLKVTRGGGLDGWPCRTWARDPDPDHGRTSARATWSTRLAAAPGSRRGRGLPDRPLLKNCSQCSAGTARPPDPASRARRIAR